MFKKLENTRPFLKMAFEGFAGDGKTYTATQVAIGVHKLIKSQKPIALFDTEKAFKALLPVFEKNGVEAVHSDEHRSLKALNEAIKWCESGGADILIIDSITHVWEAFKQSFLDQKTRNKNFLEFQDWNILKPRWKREFSDVFVAAKCHIIFTGRAGYEYDQEVNEQTNKKELTKSGIKMKSEGETAFEPDILVLMEKHQDLLGAKKKVMREATIIKDRTDTIDGKSFMNPTFNNFLPAISVLLKGAVKPADATPIMMINDTFEDEQLPKTELVRSIDLEISGMDGIDLNTKQGQSIRNWTLKNIFNTSDKNIIYSYKLEAIQGGLYLLTKFVPKFNKYIKDCHEFGDVPKNEKILQILEETRAEVSEEMVEGII